MTGRDRIPSEVVEAGAQLADIESQAESFRRARRARRSELVDDYRERTRMMSWRVGFIGVGTLVGASAQKVAELLGEGARVPVFRGLLQRRDADQGVVHQDLELVPVVGQHAELEIVGNDVLVPRLGLGLEAAHQETADLLLEVDVIVRVAEIRRVAGRDGDGVREDLREHRAELIAGEGQRADDEPLGASASNWSSVGGGHGPGGGGDEDLATHAHSASPPS